jgi:hypothetical protein
VIALQQERKAPRPTFSNAYDYYTDYYSEKEESTFRIVKDSWENIHRSNDPSKKITSTDLKLISIISTLVRCDPLEQAYFSPDYLCARLDITDRQLRTVRKNINHIFSSRWRKATRINGALKKNVYVFAYTLQGRDLLGVSAKYSSTKSIGLLPTSINKDDKYKKDRSSESSFCKNSNSSQAKVYCPKFKQYDQPKTLGDHYPLTAEDCSELQRRSSREFTLNAMNEILLDMSRKPKESKHEFHSKAAFMAYMSKVYRYEGRDAVKTANTGFKILTRATEAEVIAHTTQAEREEYLAEVEQRAITNRSDETQYRAKLAATLKPSQAYNFLSNLKTVCKVGDIFEVHMSQDVLLTNHSRGLILSAANAVGGYSGVKKMEFIEKQEVTKHAN